MNQEIRDAAANVLKCEANIKRLDLQMQLCRESNGGPANYWHMQREWTEWYAELQAARYELVDVVLEALDMRLSVESVVETQLEAFGLNDTVDTTPGFAATADTDFINELLEEEKAARRARVGWDGPDVEDEPAQIDEYPAWLDDDNIRGDK